MLNDFRHVNEKKYMAVLLQNPIIHAMLAVIDREYASLTFYAQIIDRNFLVTEKTCPRLYRLLCIAREKLGIDETVPLYLGNEYAMAAKTIGGQDDYAIILSSSCLEEYSDDELTAILGHELGHIGCGHIEFLELVDLLDDIERFLPDKISEIALATVRLTMINWLRTADYTADRAAAICCGDTEVVLSALTKSAGGTDNRHGIDFDYRRIVKNVQNAVLPDHIGMMQQIVAQALLHDSPVPFVTARMAELSRWSASGECRELFPQVGYNFYGSDREEAADHTLFEQGVKDLSANRAQGLAKIHFAAKTGSLEAMDCLGRMYVEGKLIRRNVYTGVEYLRKAALAGHVNAVAHLGMLLEKGVKGYLPRDPEAASWMLRYAAAEEKSMEKEMEDVMAGARRQYLDAIREGLHEYCQKKPLNHIAIREDYGGGNQGGGEETLRKLLWIPRNEAVYAYEQSGQIADQLLAVCDTGIFYKRDKGIPRYMSWSRFARGNLIGKKNYDMMDFLLDGDVMCSVEREEAAASIAGLLVILKNFMERRIVWGT